MSYPNIPNITPNITVGRDDVINLLLASIAMEELGLAHIINAEGEKIQYSLGTLPGSEPASIEDVLKVNKNVQDTMEVVIKKELLLDNKLKKVVDIIPDGNGPTNQNCCPCTNLLANPGFDLSAVGEPPASWASSGAEVFGVVNAHSGRFTTSAITPTLQAVGILGLDQNPDEGDTASPGYISQSVPVSAGCCYTLSFAADVRDNGLLVASVSFPGTTCPVLITRTGTDEGVETNNPIFDNNIPHIIPVSNQPQSSFQHYELVVCVPAGATTACITFQNIGNPEPGGRAFVDNVVFQTSGGPCNTCTQRY